MFFKLTSRNAYRDFVKNCKRIAQASISNQEKIKEYNALYSLVSKRLFENELCLNSSPAFSKRCEHWNAREITSIRPVNAVANPWLAFKREFEKALNEVQMLGCAVCSENISRSLAWFYSCEYKEDWIND